MSQPTWKLRLQPAPAETFSLTKLGVVEERSMLASVGGPSMNTGVDLSLFVPRISSISKGTTKITHFNRNGVVFGLGPDMVNVAVRVDSWTPEDWEVFRRFLRTHRPFLFTPGYGRHTIFATNFSSFDAIGHGMSEVGPHQDTILTRGIVEEWPGFNDEVDALDQRDETGLTPPLKPKIGAGNIGGAMLFEGVTRNLVPDSSAWTLNLGVPAAIVSGYGINNPNVPGVMFALDDSGTQALELPQITGAINGKEMTFNVDIIGEGGPIIVRAFDMANRDSAEFLHLPGSGIHRFTRNWVQNGTTIDLSILLGPSAGSGDSFLGQVTTTVVLEDCEVAEGSPADGVTPAGGDALKLDFSQPVGGASWTFLLWYWNNFDSSQSLNRPFAASQFTPGGGGAWEISRVGDTYVIDVMGFGADEQVVSVAPVNTWVQFAMVVRSGGIGKGAIEVYENGVLLSSEPINIQALTGLQNIFIGGGDPDVGNIPQKCAQTWFDYCRIQLSAMTAQEIAEDFAIRTDPGIKQFLEFTQGRLYEPRNIPPGFRGGTILSSIAGTLDMGQVGFLEGGVI